MVETFAMLREATYPPAAVNVLVDSSESMAAFQVFLYGRFWMFTEGRLAQEVGINLETVRFYERKGLLAKPPRSTSGYRLFPADTARRLRFIKRAQELGFSLSEIRELLMLRLSPRTTSTEIRKRTEAKIADIEGKITSLDSMRKSLLKLARSCGGCAPLSECPILESLDREGG